MENDSPYDSHKEVHVESQPGVGLEVVIEEGKYEEFPVVRTPDSRQQECYCRHFSQLPPLPPITPLPPFIAPQKKILGLRRTTFILSAALAAVVIAAVLGGGVGGALSVKNAETRCLANLDQQATPTSTGRVVVPTQGMLALDCPGISGTTISIKPPPNASPEDNVEARFSLDCGGDILSTSPASNDILSIVTYSLSDCLRACASYNRYNEAGACKGVVFYADMDPAAERDGTCLLKKDGALIVKQTAAQSGANLYAAGVLLV